ncbi:MAG: PDZ domain-containing protein [Steroidobacteraceae bacterium]|nr:PDZ domain-containing protein [Steroidobacteraceae bacterium]
MIPRMHIGSKFAGSVAVALLVVSGNAAGAAPADQQAPEANRAALEKQLADARAELDSAAQEVARLTGELYGDQQIEIVKMIQGERRGAMLGVNIGGTGQRSDGVEIVGVSPGGPAEAAGLRAGDVIVAVDGQALKRSEGRNPASQLVTYMRDVKPGQAVKVQYLRDGKRATASVKATAAGPMFSNMMGDHEMEMEIEMHEGMPLPGFHRFMLQEPGFGPLELVTITPGLGKYFGADSGLLVVRAPAGPGLGLADGDVLVTIGGRAPESPGQAFRILQSYEPGDKVKLGILRDRKRMELDVTMPPRGAMHGRGHAAPPAPGRPPVPAMPMPPADKADPT